MPSGVELVLQTFAAIETFFVKIYCLAETLTGNAES